MATEAVPASGHSTETSAGPVVLCGLGRVGRSVLNLLRGLGEAGTVITVRPAADSPADERIRIITGDARDEDLLERAGIAKAKALIAVTDDDLVNVTIALHARNRAPALPVVGRLFDQDLAAHLRLSLGICHGYSTSALAAPTFVAAALGDKIRSALELEGESWFVEDIYVQAGSAWNGRTVADVTADGLTVLAWARADEFSNDPRADRVLATGDTLTVMVQASSRVHASSPRFRSLFRLAHAMRAWWKATPRGLRFSFYGLLALVAFSVGVFHFGMGLSSLDAYYFVMTTLSTTGYGDINLQNARPLMKIYGTLVMVSGGALFGVLFSMMTDLLLRTRFADVLAQGTSYHKEHIIVAGLGHTGFRVLRQLARLGQDVVAIESMEGAKYLGPARTLAPVIAGDASAVETLRRAGLAGAATVIAATDDDLTNLSVALAAKQANRDCRVVVRVLDRALGARMQQSLGVDAVLSVSEAAAPTLVGSILDPDAIHGVVVRDHLLLFVDQVVAKEPRVAVRGRVLLVRGKNGAYIPPTHGRTPGPGDRVLCARWIAPGE